MSTVLESRACSGAIKSIVPSTVPGEVSRVLEMPRQAEIEEFRLFFRRDHNVRRLDVAMHQTVFVRLGQGRRDLISEIAGPIDRQRAGIADVFLQVLARHVFHNQEAQRGPVLIRIDDLARVGGGDDVRMPQMGNNPHLGEEARLQPGILARLHRQHFDGYQMAHVAVFGFEDDRHAARADAVEDAVAAEHQAEGRTRQDSRRLILRQQVVLHQHVDDFIAVAAPNNLFLQMRIECFPVFGEHEIGGEEAIDQLSSSFFDSTNGLRIAHAGSAARGEYLRHGEPQRFGNFNSAEQRGVHGGDN